MSAILNPPINTTPFGLLGLLGIKNGGQNPAFLRGDVQPTMEMLGFYLDSLAEFHSASTANLTADAAGVEQSIVFPGLPNNGTSTIVPDSEVWVILEVQMQALLIAAAQALDADLVIRTRGTGMVFGGSTAVGIPLSAAGTTVGNPNVYRRIWMGQRVAPSGASLNFFTTRMTGLTVPAPGVLNFQVRLARLRV